MKTKKQIAFHGKQSIKDKYVKRVMAHYKADEIIQGVYWQNGKGCAVGCTVEKTGSVTAHEAMEKELGIPQTISYLEDGIFEGLSNGDAKKFPLRFLKAIPVGADLSLVTSKFMVWLFVDKKDGVIRFAQGEGIAAVQQVADLYKRRIKGDEPTEDEWLQAAEAAAEAAKAAEAAAWAAWAAEAAKAAKAAAWAAWAAEAAKAAKAAAWAAKAAKAAAWAAKAAEAAEAAKAAAWAAWAAAEAAAHDRMADKLIALLRSAKP